MGGLFSNSTSCYSDKLKTTTVKTPAERAKLTDKQRWILNWEEMISELLSD